MALPIFSVDSMEDAEGLMIATCRLEYDGRYRLPFSGRFEDIEAAGQLLASVWAQRREKIQARGEVTKR